MKIIIENEEVGEFTYLGVLWQRMEIGKCRKEKNWSSIDNGSANYIWRSDSVSNGTKVKLYETFVVPVLLYGSECWCSSKVTIRSVPIFSGESQILRACPEKIRAELSRIPNPVPNLSRFNVKMCQTSSSWSKCTWSFWRFCLSEMHYVELKTQQIHFRPGLCPGPRWGSVLLGECTTLRMYDTMGGITSHWRWTPWAVPLKCCRRPWRLWRLLLADISEANSMQLCIINIRLKLILILLWNIYNTEIRK